MDTEQVQAYFKAVYSDGDKFELVAVRDGSARRKTFAYPDDLDTVLTACEAFEKAEFNVYASVLPLRVQESGTYDRIWMDRDDPEGPWPFGADPNWGKPAWPDPTVLVRTSQEPGRGERWQAIWKLAEPMDEDQARHAIKRLAEEGGGDPAVHDPRRVLRIPGIRNAKRDSTTRLLSSRNQPISFGSFLIPDANVGDGLTAEALMHRPVTAPQMVLGEWLDGATEGDRARKAYVTARFLKSCGVGFDDAAALIRVGAHRCDPPLSDEEAIHAVRSAYHQK